MQLKYGLDERPPAWETIVYGLQWFAVTVPIIVIIGKISAGLHFSGAEDELVYMQKLAFVMALTLLAQVLAGHRLPLVAGPSSVLLIGMISSRASGPSAIYSAILLGGVLLSLLSVTTLFAHLKRFFTGRVVAVVLLLIAFTLAPTILGLISSPQPGSGPLANCSFAMIFIPLLFLGYGSFKGVWKSTMIVWAMIFGSILFYVVFPGNLSAGSVQRAPWLAGFFRNLTTTWTVDTGVVMSFFFCYLALSINDLGSIQSLNELLKPPGESKRITRGILVTGIANILSGFLGVIGPVNFSMSPGVIASSGCASRITLLPAALLLLIVAFSPALIGIIHYVPSVVIGSIFFFILCSQVAAGLSMLHEPAEGFRFETGLVIGGPILLGTIISFMPADILQNIPGSLRPILGNGFVFGVAAALFLEHVVFRKKSS